MIESFYRMTNRDRTDWDAETLLALSIARHNMQEEAKKASCEQPYHDFSMTEEEAEEQNDSVVSNFFNRWKT